MKFLDSILGWTGFVLVCLVVLLSPWVFGAWEMWWFWPFAVCIFLATFILGLRFVSRSLPGRRGSASKPAFIDVEDLSTDRPRSRGISPAALWLALSFIPFLVYGLIRFLQADVYMDAERSFLRHLTPFLLGIHIVFGLSRRQRRALFVIIVINLCLLSLYGVINHWITGSGMVLWRKGYAQYVSDDRATGTYFCPDHYSGIAELALCAAIGIFTARDRKWPWKIVAVLITCIALMGIVLSKSRGGGLTVVVIVFAAVIWGAVQWPVGRRWYVRFCALAVVVMVGVVFWNSGRAYVERFKNYRAWRDLQGKSLQDTRRAAWEGIRATSRGRMIGGAIRAWRTEPIWGIGPGMHQNVWFHFAATPDGDRDAGIWPSQPNSQFHSYEVHSDWVQLLEEYGAVGLCLFLIPTVFLLVLLLRGLLEESRDRRANDWESVEGEAHDILITGFLAYICMAFHSLGDFNLQMPATVWTLAAVLSIAVAHAARRGRARAGAATNTK